MVELGVQAADRQEFLVLPRWVIRPASTTRI